VRGDDGFHLWANGAWGQGGSYNITPANQWLYAYGDYYEVKFTLPAGWYDVGYDMWEGGGAALIDMSWEKQYNYYTNIETTLNSFFNNTSNTNNEAWNNRSIQDKWDRVSGESAQCQNGNFTSGDKWQVDMPSDVYNIYQDLSTSIFGSVKGLNTGYAYDYGYYQSGYGTHSGLDINGANYTDQVRSAVTGKVVKIVDDETQGKNNGYWVAIDELDTSGNKTGRRWWYGHLAVPSVAVGNMVTGGQSVLTTIGHLGHLHLTVVNTSSDTVNYGEVSNGTTGNYTNDVNFVLGRTIGPLQAYWKSRNGIKE
jgi:hypothetical protein